jgi:hypothetical protein
MSNEFGYIPESPEQSFGNNKGIFTPTDIYDLTRADKYTNYGQLELIQTQTVSSATVDFTALQETTYKIHYFTFTNIHFGSQSEFGYRLSDDGGSSYETGYRFANQRLTEQGTSSERKSTSQNTARLFGDISNNALSAGNGYMYLYNAGNDLKYSYSTSHSTFRDASDKCAMEYGSQAFTTTSQINAIRFGLGTSLTAIDSGTVSCYGIKEYS